MTDREEHARVSTMSGIIATTDRVVVTRLRGRRSTNRGEVEPYEYESQHGRFPRSATPHRADSIPDCEGRAR